MNTFLFVTWVSLYPGFLPYFSSNGGKAIGRTGAGLVGFVLGRFWQASDPSSWTTDFRASLMRRRSVPANAGSRHPPHRKSEFILRAALLVPKYIKNKRRDLHGCLRVLKLMTVKQEVTLRLISVMTTVSLLTFGALVETYKLLS